MDNTSKANVAEKKVPAKNRIAKWDNIKFFLIIFVVLGHFINETVLNDYEKEYKLMEQCVFFIYTFHMPAFIFLSGLYAKRTVDNKRYDKIGSYLRLYFVMTFIVFAAKFVVQAKAPYALMYEIGVPWYALSLFSMYLIMIFLRPYHKYEIIVGTILLGMVIGYDRKIGSFLCLSRTLTFLPFFVLGYYFDAKKFLDFLEKKVVKVISALVLIGYIVVINLTIKDSYFMYHNFLKGRSTYPSTFKIAVMGEFWNSFGWLYRLGYYFVAFAIMVAFFSIIPNVNLKFITKLGSRTLPVYAIHYAVVFILVDGCKINEAFRDMKDQRVAFILIILLSIAVQLILSIKPLADVFAKMMSTPNSEKN